MLSYLDGASASYLVAAFAGGIAGIVVFFRMYWHRFLGLFSKKHRAKAEEARTQLVPDDDAEVSTDASLDDVGAPLASKHQ